MRRRLALITLAGLAVVVVGLGWFVARPWWQQHRLVAALEHVEHVADVRELSGGEPASLGVALDDDADLAQLRKTVAAVRSVASEHPVDGDVRTPWVLVAGHPLGPADPTVSPASVVLARSAATVDGLVPDRADAAAVTMRADDVRALPALAVGVLDALARDGVDLEPEGTSPRLVLTAGQTMLSIDVRDPRSQRAVLAPTVAVLDELGLGLVPRFSPDLPNRVVASGAGVTCELLVSVEPDRLATATRRLERAPGCSVRLDVEGVGEVGTAPGTAETKQVQRFVALRDRLREDGLALRTLVDGRATLDLPDRAAMDRLVTLVRSGTFPADAYVLVDGEAPVVTLDRDRLLAAGPAVAVVAGLGYPVELVNDTVVLKSGGGRSDPATRAGREALVTAVTGPDAPRDQTYVVDLPSVAPLRFTVGDDGRVRGPVDVPAVDAGPREDERRDAATALVRALDAAR